MVSLSNAPKGLLFPKTPAVSAGRSFSQAALLQRWAVLTLYAVLVAAGILRHEPWRDETHAWLIVDHSDSLPALLTNTRYEGHPMLWFGLLYGVKLLGGSFLAVQYLHGLLGLLTAYLLLTYAPFPFGVRVALLFSYFLGYEYVLIARNYAIGVLLIVGLCVLFPWRHRLRGHLLLCGLVALVCQTNIFAFLTGLSLYGVILLEAGLYRSASLRTHWPRYVLGLVLVAAGAGVALYYSFLMPPSLVYSNYTHDPPGWTAVLHVAGVFWSVFVPLPAEIAHFWNTHLLRRMGNFELRLLLQAGLSVTLVAGLLLPLFRSRLALLGWVGACGLMLYILSAHYFGSMRHHGHLAVSLLALLWVQPQLADYRAGQAVVGYGQNPFVRAGLGVVLAAQVLTAGLAYWADWRYPFSMNQAVAHYVRTSPMRHWFWAGDADYAVEGIAAYLPANRMYYPGSGQHGEFIRWNTQRHRVSVGQAVDSVRHIHHGPALLILNRPAEPRVRQAKGLSLVRSFTGSIVPDEQYWLYALDSKPAQ